MRVLVAGGAGFLGSHLIDKLLQLKYHVICVDNLYTGSLKNIEHLKNNKNFRFVNHDVTFELNESVTGIFNLACPASPIQYQKNPVQTLKTSFLGTMNLLDLAIQNNARFLQASTSEIYGDPTVCPQPEDYWGNVNPIGIRSCYDEGKRAAETLTFDYHRQFKVDIRVARIFNTYGPRMDPQDGRVISNFIVQALQNQTITVYGDGTQTRSFCYVDDLVEALIKLFLSKDVYEPINLGNPAPINIFDLANEIKILTRSSSRIEMLPLPHDDPKQREPDILKARSLLGWYPTIDRKAGLEKTIEYFRNLIAS